MGRPLGLILSVSFPGQLQARLQFLADACSVFCKTLYHLASILNNLQDRTFYIILDSLLSKFFFSVILTTLSWSISMLFLLFHRIKYFVFIWASGHAGIPDNVQVDQAAKANFLQFVPGVLDSLLLYVCFFLASASIFCLWVGSLFFLLTSTPLSATFSFLKMVGPYYWI